MAEDQVAADKTADVRAACTAAVADTVPAPLVVPVVATAMAARRSWIATKWASLGSMTVGWTYIMFAGSAVMELIFQIPDIANEFGASAYVPPRWLPWYTAAMALVTLLARLRSIIWKDDHIEEYVRKYTDADGKDQG